MKIAVIGHSYHLKTRSNDFFLELIRGCGEVEVFVDASWEGQARAESWAADFHQDDYDCIVVYQAHETFAHLDTRHPNLVFVPMYDAMIVEGGLWWKQVFSDAKVLCFSSTLAREVASLAPIRHFAQYFPDPRRLPESTAVAGGPSGFFWYRRAPITLELLARLTGPTEFERLTLHWAPDPVGEHREPSGRRPLARRFERTGWFPDRTGYLERIAEHSVFFAPRLYEGVGIGFLEAMAMGLCVVAPALPTHTEYVSHGSNGLLYPPDAPVELSFARHRELGQRARDRAERGRRQWELAESGVREFLSTPRENLSRRPVVVDFFRRAQGGDLPSPAGDGRERPSVTVVTVCLDAVGEIEETLRSVREQDYPDVEYVVIDGGSTDGTVDVLERNAAMIDFWRTRPDQRAYTSMMEALDHVSGEYVLFMNAGDVFASPRALSLLFDRAPASADAVYGHHVLQSGVTDDDFRIAADFEETWGDLRRGRLSLGWLQGIPCHQAIAVRSTWLRELGFDPAFRIAADHDLYFRFRRGGARFHNSAEVVAVYRAGGLSSRFYELCVQEWLRIAVRYGPAGSARRFYGESGLSGQQVWAATLRGLFDRASGRARRRFGREFSETGSPVDFGRPSLGSRALGRLVDRIASALAWAEQSRRRIAAFAGARAALPEAETTYRATLEEGIDFGRVGRPRFVARWSGLSYREWWGRWSDGDRIEIHFSRPLPERFDLIVEACAIGDNTRLPIRICAGAVSREVRISSEPPLASEKKPSPRKLGSGDSPFESVDVGFETSGREKILTLEVPRPTQPAERWPGSTVDRRALGIALHALRIVAR